MWFLTRVGHASPDAGSPGLTKTPYSVSNPTIRFTSKQNIDDQDKMNKGNISRIGRGPGSVLNNGCLNLTALEETVVCSMSEFPLRSPSAKIGGIFHFGRMLDKIRLHARGKLLPDYQANLGKGFDGSCVKFLGVDYGDLAERVNNGDSDEEILKWCVERGRRPSEREIHVWNEFMRKLGWNDEVAETLKRRKRERGLEDRSDIETMFQFIDADEGRKVGRTNL
jgi:Domain of unknown function (DUF5069)